MVLPELLSNVEFCPALEVPCGTVPNAKAVGLNVTVAGGIPLGTHDVMVTTAAPFAPISKPSVPVPCAIEVVGGVVPRIVVICEMCALAKGAVNVVPVVAVTGTNSAFVELPTSRVSPTEIFAIETGVTVWTPGEIGELAVLIVVFASPMAERLAVGQKVLFTPPEPAVGWKLAVALTLVQPSGAPLPATVARGMFAAHAAGVQHGTASPLLILHFWRG